MNLETFFTNYGYIAIFIGAAFEGELVVSFAGSLAYNNILYLPYVIILSTLGTMFAEQICFYLGRFLGSKYLHRINKFQDKINTIFSLVKRYQTLFILSCRFLYGLRNLSPLIIGAARVDPIKFSILNAVAAVIWSLISVGIGYMGAYVSQALGYSNIAGHCLTFILILTSIIILGFFIKQFLKSIKNTHKNTEKIHQKMHKNTQKIHQKMGKNTPKNA